MTQKERIQLEEIEQNLKQYLKAKEKTTENILNILKTDCNLYKELKEKVFKCKKQFLYEGKSDYREIFDAIDTVIEKEKSNLQIVNHS
ncbi:MAG: hypothetical protein H2184_04245 [Candidatus Galacturonibacter soehngenii]|nr:hypothetical protein [Candidatus Galacturonibacter soehngenii]